VGGEPLTLDMAVQMQSLNTLRSMCTIQTFLNAWGGTRYTYHGRQSRTRPSHAGSGPVIVGMVATPLAQGIPSWSLKARNA
jgi:hypothetical protein